MVVRNIDSSVIRHAQERIAAARLWIRMLLIIGFVVDFFSNLLGFRLAPYWETAAATVFPAKSASCQ